MSGLGRATHDLRRGLLDPEHRRQGLQLAVAVVTAYAVSMSIGLPEHFWAPMSVLIVMRPQAGDTLVAGGDRIRGTLLGALFGLLGVMLERGGVNATAATLGVVALLAFACAAVPSLRSAPVAALIVLGAGELAGHSPLQAAGLRVVQIGIGVGVATAVALASSRHHAAKRLRTGCASMLGRVARRMVLEHHREAPDEARAHAARAVAGLVLSRLNALAGSADRESRPFRRANGAGGSLRHRRIAWLTERVFQDTLLLERMLRDDVLVPDRAVAREAALAAGEAIASVADVVGGRGRPELRTLAGLAAVPVPSAAGALASSPSTVLLAAPLRLLLQDLQQLCRYAASDPHGTAMPEGVVPTQPPRA